MFQKGFKNYRMITLYLGALFLFLVISCAVYSVFSHQLIRAMYQGKSMPILNGIIQGQSINSVEYYIHLANRFFFGLNFYFCVMAFFICAYMLEEKSLFYSVIIFYVAYSIIFIINASFVKDGVRYFTLFDDVMIGMRYAQNLAHGYGLGWNVTGLRVEGYTSILWVLYMAFWHLLPIGVAKISLPISISGMIFIIGSLFLVRKIVVDIFDGNKYISIGAVLLTAWYAPINFWALRGRETSLLGLIVLGITWCVLKSIESKKFIPFLYILMGVALLLRADFVVLYAAVVIFMVIVESKNRTKNILYSLIIFLCVAGGQTIFRVCYYGDIFPNTYYLKVTGVPVLFRVMRGASVALKFINNMSVFVFSLPFICVILHRKEKKYLFLIYLFLTQLFYSIYVGGDSWEDWGSFANRFLCIVMPLFYILMALMLNAIMEQIKMFRMDNSRTSLAWKHFVRMIVIFLLLFQVHGGFRQKQLFVSDIFSFTGLYINHDNRLAQLGMKIKSITTSDAIVAFFSAGNTPYFSERDGIDLFGCNDRVVSHQLVKINAYNEFVPGHNKYDFSYSIGEFHPDVVQRFDESNKELTTIMQDRYEPLYIDGSLVHIRKESPNILWEELEANIRR